jgi:hypothetical protein
MSGNKTKHFVFPSCICTAPEKRPEEMAVRFKSFPVQAPSNPAGLCPL